MAEVRANERILRSDITLEECKRIEKLLQKNNISYFERWKTHLGLFGLINGGRNSRCDIYIHMDSYDEARKALGEE